MKKYFVSSNRKFEPSKKFINYLQFSNSSIFNNFRFVLLLTCNYRNFCQKSYFFVKKRIFCQKSECLSGICIFVKIEILSKNISSVQTESSNEFCHKLFSSFQNFEFLIILIFSAFHKIFIFLLKKIYFLEDFNFFAEF